MAGKFINTEHKQNIDSMVENVKNILKNPYYLWSNKTATVVTYYNTNKESSTLDESSRLQYVDTGINSPMKYNKIENFYIYGLEQIQVSLENGEYGLESGEIQGEGVILPNTITPYPGDFFSIDYLKEDMLFRIIDVSFDTLETGANLYKIIYKLESSREEHLEDQVKDSYNMVVNNLGTEYNPIIRSEKYELIELLEEEAKTLKRYFKALFYNHRVQTFIYENNCKNFYDPYMIEFIIRNELLQGDNEYIYVCHQTQLNPKFEIWYDKTFFRCLERKDLENLNYYKYKGIAEYIQDPLSIFNSRLEEYFEVNYNLKTVYFGILPSYKDEFIARLEAGNLFANCQDVIYNIIIKYFHNIDINKNDLYFLDKYIKYDNNVYMFYAIPSIIFCIESYIKNLMV